MPYYDLCEQDSMRLTDLQKEAHIMKKHGKSIVALLAMIALIVGLSGCAKEGPMEKAGKKVDKAIEDIKK
jgi:predicted small lipoprotein YifL